MDAIDYPPEHFLQPAAPKVFVTNFAGHDYSEAKKYGEIVCITKGYVSLQSLDRLKYTIMEALIKSRKQDWLLISGKPIISVIAATTWFLMHDQVKLLVWDQKGKNNKYRELIMTRMNIFDVLRQLI